MSELNQKLPGTPDSFRTVSESLVQVLKSRDLVLEWNPRRFKKPNYFAKPAMLSKMSSDTDDLK